MGRRPAIVLALLGIAGLSAYLAFPLLRCPETCFVDYVAMHGKEIGNFELPDVRLNSWILGWVQHAAFSNPRELFDANAFFPAENTLSGSEHMIGNALLTLPLRLFSDSAIALHQTALVLSFAILGLSVFAFVYWAGQSVGAAFLAGAVAMFMPWRYSEVGHLQLLSAQWIPLIWMLTARLLLGVGSRRDAFGLSIALLLQLLTSFYLAYFTLFSTAFFAAAVALQQRPAPAALLRIASAAAPPLLALFALALPYVSRYTAYRFATPIVEPASTPPQQVGSFLAPSPSLLADRGRLADVSYHIPLVVFALALLPFARALRAPAKPAAVDRRIRIVSFGLLAAAVGAFVFMMGRRLAVGDFAISLPAHWAAQVLPGFAQMRAEFRWGIVIGLAFPVLAGFGIAIAQRAITGRPRSLRLGLGAALLAALALGVPWFQLPARDAWKPGNGIWSAHRALAGLPDGTSVELPWGFRRIHLANYGSRYMLASSQHWKPLLNGYTAYLPESHHFLQRIAQGLPQRQALARLRRLAGLRWVIVHPQKLKTWELKRWDAAEKAGAVRAVFSDPHTRIYEVPATAENGVLVAALTGREPRVATLAGLTRTPLDLASARGRLDVTIPTVMRYQHGSGLKTWIDVTIHNDSETIWAGYDIRPEGLVMLRYRFLDASGKIVREATAHLDQDMPPERATRARALALAPAQTGSFRVVFDLVQRVAGQDRALSVPAIVRTVEVAPARNPSSRVRETTTDPRRERADPDAAR